MNRDKILTLRKLADELGCICLNTASMFGPSFYWFENMNEAHEWFEHNPTYTNHYFFKENFFIACTIYHDKFILQTKNRIGRAIKYEFVNADDVKKAFLEEKKNLMEDIRSFREREKLERVASMFGKYDNFFKL